MADKLTICIVAPSGMITDDGGIERMTQFFHSRDINVIVPDAVRGKHQRFAGDDLSRLAALHDAFTRDEVDIVLAARGGYGLSRLLDKIDYDLLADSGKLLVGHSDITALSLAMLARKSSKSYAGPHAIGDFGSPTPSQFTIDNFFRVLHSAQSEMSVTAENPYDFKTIGTLWGGNLSLVAALVGTPYLPDIPGGILFLEDINEAPYRVERMLYQLFHSGILSKQRAILLGDFHCENAKSANNFELQNVVAHFRERLGIPILTGLPFGHIRDKLTLPMGATCSLDASQQRFRISLTDYPQARNEN